MAYIKLEIAILGDPRMRKISGGAYRLFTFGLLHSMNFLTDGFVPEEALLLLCSPGDSPQDLADELVKTGLWLKESETKGGRKVTVGYTVGEENWARHQSTRDQVMRERERSKIRKAKSRKAREGHVQPDLESPNFGAQNDVTPSVTPSVTRDTSISVTPSVTPCVTPSVTPSVTRDTSKIEPNMWTPDACHTVRHAGRREENIDTKTTEVLVSSNPPYPLESSPPSPGALEAPGLAPEQLAGSRPRFSRDWSQVRTPERLALAEFELAELKALPPEQRTEDEHLRLSQLALDVQQTYETARVLAAQKLANEGGEPKRWQEFLSLPEVQNVVPRRYRLGADLEAGKFADQRDQAQPIDGGETAGEDAEPPKSKKLRAATWPAEVAI